MNTSFLLSQLPWTLARLAFILVPALIVAKRVSRTKASGLMWGGVLALALHTVLGVLYSGWISSATVDATARVVIGTVWTVLSVVIFGVGMVLLIAAAAAGRQPTGVPGQQWQGTQALPYGQQQVYAHQQWQAQQQAQAQQHWLAQQQAQQWPPQGHQPQSGAQPPQPQQQPPHPQ